MISVSEALELVRRSASPSPARAVKLEEALGLVLAEDVATACDSPPHDKSLVDGFAVRSADAARAGAELTVVERITAGDVPALPITMGRAAQIMTGAPIPEGADSVVMVEQTELLESGDLPIVRLLAPATAGQNIMRRGASMRSGQCVLRAGKRLRPIEIGLLAEVGRAEVQVYPAPSVAICSTGNELVEHSEEPRAGQIRNSNGPMLAALVQQAGGRPRNLGIVRDEVEELRRAIATGLECEILVLSGGVSAGVMDLVPRVLSELGVAQVFHKVDLKPGKPLWFGIRVHERGRTLVFGLPGNPVSTLVCFELFVRPTIATLAGRADERREPVRARLAIEHAHRGDRPTYFPAALETDGTATGADYQVRPLAWKGSADLCTLTEANSLAYFPPGTRLYGVGEPVDVWPLE